MIGFVGGRAGPNRWAAFACSALQLTKTTSFGVTRDGTAFVDIPVLEVRKQCSFPAEKKGLSPIQAARLK